MLLQRWQQNQRNSDKQRWTVHLLTPWWSFKRTMNGTSRGWWMGPWCAESNRGNSDLLGSPRVFGLAMGQVSQGRDHRWFSRVVKQGYTIPEGTKWISGNKRPDGWWPLTTPAKRAKRATEAEGSSSIVMMQGVHTAAETMDQGKEKSHRFGSTPSKETGPGREACKVVTV